MYLRLLKDLLVNVCLQFRPTLALIDDVWRAGIDQWLQGETVVAKRVLLRVLLPYWPTLSWPWPAIRDTSLPQQQRWWQWRRTTKYHQKQQGALMLAVNVPSTINWPSFCYMLRLFVFLYVWTCRLTLYPARLKQALIDRCRKSFRQPVHRQLALSCWWKTTAALLCTDKLFLRWILSCLLRCIYRVTDSFHLPLPSMLLWLNLTFSFFVVRSFLEKRHYVLYLENSLDFTSVEH